MGSKDHAYGAFEVYRVCFACGRTEKVEVEDRGGSTPQQEVVNCADCGSRMYSLQGVEAYFDRFFGDSALADSVIDTLSFIDPENLVSGDVEPGEFEVTIVDQKLRFRSETRGFVERFKRCAGVSKRHALKMLRNEATLLTKEWKSPVMGVFRTRGTLAGTMLESMFCKGRFTLEDSRYSDAEFGVSDDGGVTVTENGKTHAVTVKDGCDEWLVDAYPRVGSDKGRQAACIASACTMGLESTVAADIDPGYVVRDGEVADVTKMMAMKAKAAFGDACSMEITDDGRLVISAESRSTDDILRALASVGIVRPTSVGDGVVLADARAYVSAAIREEFTQASATKLEPELRKGLQDVLGALSKAAAKRDPGHFATMDDLKTIAFDDAVALVKELRERGYVEPVVEGWSYVLTLLGEAVLSERDVEENVGEVTVGDVLTANDGTKLTVVDIKLALHPWRDPDVRVTYDYEAVDGKTGTETQSGSMFGKIARGEA